MAVNQSPGKRRDPLPVFCFKVQIALNNGENGDAFFRSVSGLRSETEVVPVRAGGTNHTTHQLVGATKWSNIVLKQGFTGSSGLLEWRDRWVYGPKRDRLSGFIIQLSSALTEVARWEFSNGWPCKWEVSELDASKSEIAIETLEIAHEGLRFVTGK